MVDLITGPIDSSADVAAQGASVARPSSLFSDIDPFETFKQVARGIGYGQAQFGITDPESGRVLDEPEPSVPPEDLKSLEVPDAPDMKGLKFANPLPLSVAQTMHDAKQEEIMRASIAGNQPGGFGVGLARGVTGLAAGMLDPINVAASLMPVAGEARLGAALLRSFGEETAGRLASSFGVGAARGLAGQAPLVALRFGLSQQEQADYTASNAMADLFMGTLLGGGLHTVIEGAGDWLGGRFRRSPEAAIVEASPDVREATMRAAVAAVAEDRPVGVAPYIRLQEPMPAVDQRLLSLAAEEANLRAQDETLASARSDVPPEATAAETTLARLEAIETQLHDEITPENRKALLERQDELLGSVNPEDLHTAAQPAREARQAANQRASIATRLEEIAGERRTIAVDAALGPRYINGDIAAEWRGRVQKAGRELAGSDAVRAAAGSPDAAVLDTVKQAEAAAKAPPPPSPDLPPETDAEAATRHMDAAKALIEHGTGEREPNWQPAKELLEGHRVKVSGLGALHDSDTGWVAAVVRGFEHEPGVRRAIIHFDDGEKLDIPVTEEGLSRVQIDPDQHLVGSAAAKAAENGATRAETPAQRSPAGAIAGLLTREERAEIATMTEAQSRADGEANAFEAAGACFAQGLIGNG